MSSFGKRLKELRLAKKLRQKDLANDLRLAQTTIANYEKDIRFPNDEILVAFADYFDVSLDYLLGRTEETPVIRNTVKTSSNSSLFSQGEVIPIDVIKDKYVDLLLKGNKKEASRLILSAVKNGASIEDIYLKVFSFALIKIGEMWEKNEINVCQEHFFSESTQSIMSQLYPYISSTQKKNKSVVTLCVNGEHHCIGLRMVNDLLELDGFNTYFVGDNVPTNSLIDVLKMQKADILAISATMYFNINSVTSLINTIRQDKYCKSIKIIVGGSTFNTQKELWKKVGADGYALNAVDAVRLANDLVV